MGQSSGAGELEDEGAEVGLIDDDLGRGQVRSPGRGLPAEDLDGDHGRDLAGVADEHESPGDLAEEHELRPGALPGFLQKEDVEGLLFKVDGAPLRGGSHGHAGPLRHVAQLPKEGHVLAEVLFRAAC